METKILNRKNMFLAKKKSINLFFYVIPLLILTALVLIALDVITLNKILLVVFGLLAVGAIFILAFTNLNKFLLAFTLYLPFSRMLPGDFGTGTWAFNLTNIFFILAIFAIFKENLTSNLNLSLKSSITIPIIIFSILGILSFIKSGFYFGYVYFGQFLSPLKEWLLPLFLFFLFFVSVKNKNDIRQFVMLITIITICIAVLVVFEYLKVREADDFEKMRVGAIFEQPNSAGAFFVYYAFILVGLFLMNIRKYRYWFLSLPILVSARALMYTFSRGAIIAFVCAGLFITFIKNKLMFLIVCLLLVLAFLKPTILPSALYYRFSSTFVKDKATYDVAIEEKLEPSAQQRIVVWRGAIQMIKDHPLFGVGYGVFPHLISFYAPVGQMDAHNTYLILFAELGLIGLISFLWIIALIFKNTWFVYRKAKDKFIKAFALGFLAGIFGLMVCNIFGSRLDSLALTGFFWILAALIFKSKRLIKAGQL
ncbi:MAG: hypothetical protein A2166_00380 [Omnitrophica WOR_2 bacterium RBG_13_41_10]|nr:MAG: hypothetical protein A2166_00380 [Omnitrophica WOR_2 bacterium RBG_13_41_10]